MNKKNFIIVTILFIIISLSTVGLEDRWFNYANQVLPLLYAAALLGPMFAGNIRKSAWRIAFIFWILFNLVLLGLYTLQFVSGTETKFIRKWVLATDVAYLSVIFVLGFVLYLKSKREKTK